MDEIIFKTTVKVNFCELGKDINTTLLEKAKNEYDGSCTQKYGYIIEVLEITNIIDNIVSRCQTIILFTIEIKCLRFFPEIGKIIKTNIKQILAAGIYLTYCKLNILITKKTLENAEIKGNTIKIKEKEYKSGDDMLVEILNLKYENKKFSCIGKYIS
jgi:DNA-directed RNA polymerase subunit E'/Rpb7